MTVFKSYGVKHKRKSQYANFIDLVYSGLSAINFLVQCTAKHQSMRKYKHVYRSYSASSSVVCTEPLASYYAHMNT